MRNKIRLVFLSKEFYEKYSNYEEILHKKNRPYVQVLIELNDLKIAVPLRTNIKHKYAYWTNKQEKCGLDFTKSVVIEDISYIDYQNKPIIRQEEYDFLKDKNYIVTKKMEKYIKDFFLNNEKQLNKRDLDKIEKSSLKYFSHLFL